MLHETIKQCFMDAVDFVASNISLYAVNPSKDFTRSSKFSIDKLLPFLVSRGSSSSKLELLDFFGFHSDSPSASALVQQQAKLKPDALEALFHQFHSSVSSDETPQLMLYSTALGGTALAVRIISCILCGIAAGIAVRIFFRKKGFFHFDGFAPGASRDTDPNPFLRFLKNLGRNVRATGLYFLIGVLLSALFQRYVPADDFAGLFGENEGFGLLLAATIGVPLYACGGGTIPLLQQWLSSGMSMGAASSFMITGPATKITNLGALKIVLGIRHFLLYLAFVMIFSLATGMVVNLLV